MAHYRAVVDAWRFFKAYRHRLEDAEGFYDELIAEAESLVDKHGSVHQFMQGIMSIIIDELNRIAEGEKNG